MNREDIIKLAREADSYADKHGPSAWRHPDEFAAFRDERFAALVAEHERKRWHKAGARAIRMAINIEREACAKVCDELHPGLSTKRAAEYIRARGQA